MILIRGHSDDQGTYGHLVFDGDYVHTIELPDRNNRPNYSRIPAGRYRVQMRVSPKYGKVYHVQDVSGRTHILLHHGNYAGDRLNGWRTHSAGCILLGTRRGRLHGQNAVLNSRIARRRFEDAMNWEKTELVIIDGMG